MVTKEKGMKSVQDVHSTSEEGTSLQHIRLSRHMYSLSGRMPCSSLTPKSFTVPCRCYCISIITRCFCQKRQGSSCRQAAVKAAKFRPLVRLARSKQDPINRGHGAQFLHSPPPARAKCQKRGMINPFEKVAARGMRPVRRPCCGRTRRCVFPCLLMSANARDRR